MKKTIFSLCLAISAFCLSGCSDFLDREPYGKDATWKTKEDVDQAIYALYHFVSPYWSEEICGRGHMWLECASDNILIAAPVRRSMKSANSACRRPTTTTSRVFGR